MRQSYCLPKSYFNTHKPNCQDNKTVPRNFQAASIIYWTPAGVFLSGLITLRPCYKLLLKNQILGTKEDVPRSFDFHYDGGIIGGTFKCFLDPGDEHALWVLLTEVL